MTQQFHTQCSYIYPLYILHVLFSSYPSAFSPITLKERRERRGAADGGWGYRGKDIHSLKVLFIKQMRSTAVDSWYFWQLLSGFTELSLSNIMTFCVCNSQSYIQPNNKVYRIVRKRNYLWNSEEDEFKTAWGKKLLHLDSGHVSSAGILPFIVARSKYHVKHHNLGHHGDARKQSSPRMDRQIQLWLTMSPLSWVRCQMVLDLTSLPPTS